MKVTWKRKQFLREGPVLLLNTVVVVIVVFALVATAARGQTLWRTYYWSTDFVGIQFIVYNLKLLHRHACKCWLTGNIWYTVCINLHTKIHTPGTYGHCRLLQNRKLIKYSYGSHVITLHSTKHTDLPQHAPWF